MNSFERAIALIGNRFDFVLIASERVRELNRDRRNLNSFTDTVKGKTKPNQSIIDATADIESGKIGREYLDRIVNRDLK